MQGVYWVVQPQFLEGVMNAAEFAIFGEARQIIVA